MGLIFPSFARHIDGSFVLSLASVPETLDIHVTIVNNPVTIVHVLYIAIRWSCRVNTILCCVLLFKLAVVAF